MGSEMCIRDRYIVLCCQEDHSIGLPHIDTQTHTHYKDQVSDRQRQATGLPKSKSWCPQQSLRLVRRHRSLSMCIMFAAWRETGSICAWKQIQLVLHVSMSLGISIYTHRSVMTQQRRHSATHRMQLSIHKFDEVMPIKKERGSSGSGCLLYTSPSPRDS